MKGEDFVLVQCLNSRGTTARHLRVLFGVPSLRVLIEVVLEGAWEERGHLRHRTAFQPAKGVAFSHQANSLGPDESDSCSVEGESENHVY